MLKMIVGACVRTLDLRVCGGIHIDGVIGRLAIWLGEYCSVCAAVTTKLNTDNLHCSHLFKRSYRVYSVPETTLQCEP
jgi:hypothetical protein